MKKKQFLAEVLGTFWLVFAGCGAVVVDDLYQGVLGHTGVSLVFGMIVGVMVYSIGNISGAHLNPVVSVGFWAAGRLKARLLYSYILAQFIGALTAAALLRLLFSGHGTLGATLPASGVLQAFGMEVILTFMLMFVILNVSTGHREKGIMAGVAVGATVALAALFGGPVSGASMNPARSLGPALLSANLRCLWIYLTAPLLGALLASPTCRLIQSDACCSVEQEDGE